MTQHADPTAYSAPVAGGHVPAQDDRPAGLGGTFPAQNAGAPPGAPFDARYATGTVPQPTPYGAVPLPAGSPLSPPQGFGPLPMPQFQQHALAAVPAPQAPLNTMAVASLVSSFFVSPVAIVLGVLARKQIDRTGERGRGMALAGTILGAIGSVAGIASVLIVLLVAAPAATAIAPVAPMPVSSSPVAVPAPVVPVAPAQPAGPTAAQGRAAIDAAYTDVVAATTTYVDAANKAVDSSDIKAYQKAAGQYLVAVREYRAAIQSAPLTADQRAKVDAQLMPEIDKAITDLQTLSTATSQNTVLRTDEKWSTDFDTFAAAVDATTGW